MANDGRNSKALIFAAARMEYGRRGFAGARVDRIAAEAGVNKQLIFYYFGSKAGLFGAIIADITDAIAGAVVPPEGGLPVERLRTAVNRLNDVLTANADLLRSLLHDANSQPRATGAFRKSREAFAALVSEGQGLGFFRDDLDPDLVAAQILALALGSLALEGWLGSDFTALNSARLEQSTDLALRNLAW